MYDILVSAHASRSFHTQSHDSLAILGGIGALVRIKRRTVTVMASFHCQCDTLVSPGKSLGEGPSSSGWPAGIPVRDCLN